jgi:superfamily II DNA or RNA helicase
MKKISRKGYIIQKSLLDENQTNQLVSDLTAKPKMVQGFGPNQKPIEYPIFLESKHSYYVPRFYGLSNLGQPEINNLDKGNDISIQFKGSLRKEQIPIQQLFIDQDKKDGLGGGGIISLKCGGGKTVLALSIISSLQKKSIVLVHKDFLMTQWRDRIEEFLPEARIGKIQQDTIDIENKDIVLAMVQSVAVKEYPKGTFDSFGLAIFDECHHLGAEVFFKCMRKVSSLYMLGLSATPKRKDGLQWVFESFIGPIIYQTKEVTTEGVEVNIVDYYSDVEMYCKECLNYMKKPVLPKMINNICEHWDRTEHILRLTNQYYEMGRKIIILSDRRSHLTMMLEWLNNHNIPSGLYVGGMKPFELHDSQTKDVILGTFSMAAEGMDIPKLNTIILASPKSDVVQAVGRIMREKVEVRKFHPLIIDINDTHSNFQTFKRQCQKRLTFYKQQKYKIMLHKTDGTIEEYKKKKRQSKKEIHKMDICLIDD